jgi:hypothetical protein
MEGKTQPVLKPKPRILDEAEIRALSIHHWPTDTLTLVEESDVEAQWTYVHFPDEWTLAIPEGCAFQYELHNFGEYANQISEMIGKSVADRATLLALWHQGHRFEVWGSKITNIKPIPASAYSKLNTCYRVTLLVGIDHSLSVCRFQFKLWALPNEKK